MNTLYMPQVDNKSDAELADIFKNAREAVAEGTPEEPLIGILTPGRFLLTLGGVPRSKIDTQQQTMLNNITGDDSPKTVAVIAMTDIIGQNQQPQKSGMFGSLRRAFGGNGEQTKFSPRNEAIKKIPFLGYLFALSGVGHNIVAFEGHSSALQIGCKDVDLVLIDGAMVDHLQKDWNAIITNAIKPEGVIVVFNRDGSMTTFGRTGMPEPSIAQQSFEVKAHADFPALVADARRQSGPAQIIVITADRELLPMELKTDVQLPPQQVNMIEQFVGTKEPQAITVITPMNIQGAALKQRPLTGQQITMHLAQAAPFLAHVAPQFAALGHSIIAFEGHQVDLAAGCAGANIVILDDHVGSAIGDNWTDRVRATMAEPKRILIFRKNGNVEMVN